MAVAHDYLNQMGGAERVALVLARMWPGAPVYTSMYRPGTTWDGFESLDVQTSFLDRLPINRGFRALLPLYPLAFESFDLSERDLVVSSSSAWAHGVRTSPDTMHVVYCYAPARWIYASDHYLGGRVRRLAFAPLAHMLRRWDHRAAQRADLYIVIARNVQERVRAAYGIEAEVVHPPVDTARFTPRARGDRLLVVSRLLGYKRIDLVVEAATRLGIGLDVVGVGPELARLRRLAGSNVAFHGRLPDEEVTELMETSNAVCFPGQEDFGIVPVEANAAGKPVVAFAAGGALETQIDGVTATFFDRPDVDAVVGAIRRVHELATPPEALAGAADRFSERVFRRRFLAVVRDAVERSDIPSHHGLLPLLRDDQERTSVVAVS